MRSIAAVAMPIGGWGRAYAAQWRGRLSLFIVAVIRVKATLWACPVSVAVKHLFAANRLMRVGKIGGWEIAGNHGWLAHNLVKPHGLRLLLFQGEAVFDLAQQAFNFWASNAIGFWNARPLHEGSGKVTCAITVQAEHSAGVIDVHTLPECQFFGGCLNDIFAGFNNFNAVVEA